MNYYSYCFLEILCNRSFTLSSRGKLDYTYDIDYYDKGRISKVLRFSKFADSQKMKDIMKKITDRDIHK